jgi:hypothetical protein
MLTLSTPSLRRLLLLAPLVVLVLVLTACGGGSSTPSSDNPLLDAANATAEAGSEKTSVTGTVTYGPQKLTLDGNGGYNHETDEGWQQILVTVPSAGRPSIDQIFEKSVLWMKSTLFASTLPPGKQWVKVDVDKAGKNLGFNFKALMGQTPADVLEQLERTGTPVTTVGTEEIDGVETTHYRAPIDTSKIPAGDNLQKLTMAEYKPIDVWVDADGLVRQVKLDYTAKVDPAQAELAHVLLTMKLFDFGSTVDVEAPKPALVVDVTDPVAG